MLSFAARLLLTLLNRFLTAGMLWIAEWQVWAAAKGRRMKVLGRRAGDTARL